MNIYLSLLIFSILIIIVLLIYILRNKSNNQLKIVFSVNLILLLILSTSMLLQLLLSDRLNIDPIIFEYFAYIGGCFLPVSVFFTGLIYKDTKVKFKRVHMLLFIIPIISLLSLWSNNMHHLFYKVYSINISKVIGGSILMMHNIYSYILLFVGVLLLLRSSFKNSGFFSRQSLLLLFGISVPIIVNVLGTFKIISMTVYLTPISFTITVLFCALAIFKFNFLGVSPIAIQKIVDRISDSYVVISDDGNITDYNRTFLTTFKIKEDNLRGKELLSFLKSKKFNINEKKLKDSIKKAANTQKVISYEEDIENINKNFMIEISSISSKGTFLGIVILLKDITQHKQDIQIIKDNQEQLMEKERLSSLGQLVGGIAHNLKTPIMSISGAAEGISDLIKEYESSVGDPEVTIEDHHEIASDMMEWISKIKTHTEYMSDIITAVKGQAVALSEDTNMTFTIDELIKRVNILMKHELKNAIIYLNNVMEVDKDLELKGDVNSLVQVINNMISNSIQAYAGKPEQTIDMIVSKKDDNIIISIKDYAGGLPKGVKDKLFKEMVTTKGKNGTGLGLYMSYSTIRAHFGGNIIAESEEGNGTTFNIILPIQK